MDALISARIMAKITEGMDVQEAVDFVLGDGAYAKIASDLFDALTA